jgi:hypothetical protein
MAKDDTGKTQGATAYFQGVELPAVHHHEVCTGFLSRSSPKRLSGSKRCWMHRQKVQVRR